MRRVGFPVWSARLVARTEIGQASFRGGADEPGGSEPAGSVGMQY